MSCAWPHARSWLCLPGFLQDGQPAIVRTLRSLQTERPWPWAPSPGAAAVPRWVSGRFHTGALTRGDERHGGTRAEVLPQALPPSPGNSRARGSREGGPRQRQVRRGEAHTSGRPLPQAPSCLVRVGRGDTDGMIFTKDGARGGFPLGRHGLAVTGASQPGLARVPARPAGGGNERSPSGEEAHAGLSRSPWPRRPERAAFRAP